MSDRLPKLCLHKTTGQFYVTLDGREIYLGTSRKVANVERDRLIGEWLANGRRLPRATAADDTTIIELADAFWQFAKGYYRKDGQPTGSLERVRIAVKLLREVYGPTSVGKFGPLALKSLQLRFVREGKSRRYVNHLVEQVKRVFKWGVSQELVPASIYQALATVPGLKNGRTDAREPAPILPVAPSVVDATLPHLPPVVRDMILLQGLTGCRPGEVCILRPCDVDRTGDVWEYRPASHKTQHHGRERVVPIGPQAQEILTPYLLRKPITYCFAPADSERKRLNERHARRKTALSCGNRPGTNRTRRRKLPPGERYNTGAYANAVRRGCDIADRKRHESANEGCPLDKPNVPATERIVPRWRPNQLRHRMATEVRKQFGIEAVQVVLGHARADVTQVYAERDMSLAKRIAREVG